MKSESCCFAFYDLAVCPATFDVINFVCMASAYAELKGLAGFHLVVIHGPFGGFRGKVFHSNDAQFERLNSIIHQSAFLVPNCLGTTYSNDRGAVHKLIMSKPKTQLFPSSYNIQNPLGYYNWGATNEMVAQHGVDIQRLAASKNDLVIAKKWVKRQGLSKPIITITVRASEYQPARNSMMSEWCKFAEYADGKGYEVIFVPDTENMFDASMFPDNAICCRSAALDLRFRLALYELSALNFFINNGPWLLGVLSPKVRSIIMKVNTESVEVSSAKWLKSMGFVQGENLPFLKKYQQLVWQPDTFENTVEAFEKYMSMST